MPSPYGPMHVIVDPRAGRSAVKRAWPAIREVLDEAEVEHTVTHVTRAGDGRAAAAAAIAEGRRYVVAVGGDRIVHEVVNGLMGEDAPRDPEAVLGLVPIGPAADFARTFGISEDPVQAARALTAEGIWGKLDLGRVWYRTTAGLEESRWFCNVAQAGMGATVAASAGRMSRALGALAPKIAAATTVLRYRPQDVKISMMGRRARGRGGDMASIDHAGAVTMVVVANGQFFAGGLRVAPRAIPSDAMLDVVIAEGTKGEALQALRKMPTGTHVPDKRLGEYLVTEVSVDAPEPVAIEADGEPLGTTPVRFLVVPAQISLKI